jgi:hypothetical protein
MNSNKPLPSVILSIWKYFSKFLLRNLNHFQCFSLTYQMIVHLEFFRWLLQRSFDLFLLFILFILGKTMNDSMTKPQIQINVVKLYRLYCYFAVLSLAAKNTERKYVVSPKFQIPNPKSNIQKPRSKSVLWNCTDSIAALQCYHPSCHTLVAINMAMLQVQNPKSKFQNPKTKFQNPNSNFQSQSLNHCCETVPTLLLLCSVAILRATRWRQKTRQLLLVLSKDCF